MKKMKVTLGLIFITIMSIMKPMTVQADVGPKPSVVIDFNGLEGEQYYVTLLSSIESTGPHSVLKEKGSHYARYTAEDEKYDIFMKFVEYQDEDGYYFLQFFQDCTESHQFTWGYYPPQDFKILLYFPETNYFISSEESHERYAFDSYFTVQVSDTGLMVETSYQYTEGLLSLAARMVLTILIEVGIALLFGFRERKQLYLILLANAVTQIGLNLALHIINYRSGALAFVVFYVLLELLVFMAEAILYTCCLKRYSSTKIPGWKPVVYALAANLASFLLGLRLAYWIPGIF